MNILIVGSGSREHALAWKIKKSPKCGKLFILPGNAGTLTLGENVPIDTTDHESIVRFAKEKSIDLVLVGPDNPLAEGLVDSLMDGEVKVFGPTRSAARLEWSKAYAKDFMKRHSIPTARSQAFTDHGEALHYLKNQTLPVVIKADGLALGKGVVIAATHEEAESALTSFMLDGAFGDSGKTVVIEEFLVGAEISIHAFSDGTTARLFPISRDHKRIFDGNKGPNTGGMGTIVPVPGLADGLLKEIEETIVMPVIKGMDEEGNPFQGVLYPGVMITKDGPKVIEFNARFGQPEAESYMRILETDLVDIMLACISGTVKDTPIEWSKNSALTLMLVSDGYPGSYKKGMPISGISEAEKDPSVVVFHTATKEEGGTVVSSGGRVLGVSAVGATLEEARESAYKAAEKIQFEGKQFRTDIGISAG